MFAKRFQWALASAALLVMLGGAALGAGAYAGSAKPTAVAVVDIKKVFNDLKEKTQIEAQMRSERENFQQEGKAKQNTVKSLQQDLQVLTPGNATYRAKQDDLQKAAINLQVWAKVRQNQMGQEQAAQTERLYKKTLDAVGRVAKQGGYDLVLFKESGTDFGNIDPKQLNSLIQVRKVLWAADPLDITGQVVQRMNNEYENQG